MLGNKAELLQMSFEVENTGRNLTPEYWDDHWKDDRCPKDDYTFVDMWRRSDDIVFAQDRAMRDRLQDRIERFSLLEGGNHVALAKFEKGNTFYPGNYPHGTLIRVTSEGLNFRHMELGLEPYGTGEQFGFVVDTQGITPDGENAVLYISRGMVYGGSPEKIEVGVVRHRKHHEDPTREERIDWVSRITGVEIVSMGSGTPRRIPRPIPAPNATMPVLVPKPAR